MFITKATYMWNFFKKEPKKPIKKKPVKKGQKKPATKKKPASDPLNILDRTLDKKLNEIQEHKIQFDNKKQIVQKNDKEQLNSEKKTHINKPADINFIQKTQKISEDIHISVTSKPNKTLQDNYTHFVQVLSNTIKDIEKGILFAGVTDIRNHQVLFQTYTHRYDLSIIGNFINQYLDLTEKQGVKETFLLINLTENAFLYLQIFEQHYYTLLLDKNELSLGHVLNILKPELIKNYHKTLNN